jgi:hypothetical protein
MASITDTLKKELLDNKDLVFHVLPIIHKLKESQPEITKNELLEAGGVVEKAIDALEGVSAEIKESMKSFPLLSMLIDALADNSIEKLMLIVSDSVITESNVDKAIDIIIPDGIEQKIPVEIRKSVIKIILAAAKKIIGNLLHGCMNKKAVNVVESH